MSISYHILPKTLIVNFDGQTFNVERKSAKARQIIQLIKKNKLDKIPGLFITTEDITTDDNYKLRIVRGSTYINNTKIPAEFHRKVQEFKKAKLPFKPLLNFCAKLIKNPNQNSINMLYKFLSHNGHPLTSDGNFIAYRNIKTDYKDHYTGTIDNTPGAVIELDREKIDSNPNVTCSYGLHVASWEYLKEYNPSNSITVEVEVDPRDVVCVPNDYNGTKMRVCKYRVLGVVKKPHKVKIKK